jgi:hypothetical protein
MLAKELVMISVLFFYFKEDVLPLEKDMHPLPKYLGIVHAENEKEALEIIGKNHPSGFKMASMVINGENFLIDLGIHKPVNMVQS